MRKEELKELLGKGENIRIIDVREADEYKAGDKMEGAVNIPMGQMFIDASKGKLPKNEKIVAICKSGKRCEIVARELRNAGYDIDHLEGGLEGWNQE